MATVILSDPPGENCWGVFQLSIPGDVVVRTPHATLNKVYVGGRLTIDAPHVCIVDCQVDGDLILTADATDFEWYALDVKGQIAGDLPPEKRFIQVEGAIFLDQNSVK